MPYPAKISPETILAAAMTLLEQPQMGAEQSARGAPKEHPEPQLSMRSLAAALGVRASSLYRHFADRETLDAAIADAGTRLLLRQIQDASAGQPPALALTVSGQVYLDFAHEHPRLYALMHAPRPPELAQPGPGKDLWNLLLTLVGAVTGRRDDTSAVVAFWCFLHGYIGLESSGQFGLSGPREGFIRGLNALIRGL